MSLERYPFRWQLWVLNLIGIFWAHQSPPFLRKRGGSTNKKGCEIRSLFEFGVRYSSYKLNVRGFVGRGRLLPNGLPLIFVLRGSTCVGRRISSAVRQFLGKFGV